MSETTETPSTGRSILGLDWLKLKDVTKLTTLFAVMLGVLVSIAMLWLMRAESQDERIIVGGFALLFFLALLVVLWSLVRSVPANFAEAPAAPAGGASRLSEDIAKAPVVSPAEAATSRKVIQGKQGDFLIEDPRPAWEVRWMSVAELVREETGRVSPGYYEGLQRQMPGRNVHAEDHLSVRSPQAYTIVPKPGQSRRNGRPLFTVQQSTIRPQLIVFTQNRFLPGTPTLEAFALDRLTGAMIGGGAVPFTLQTRQRADGRKAIVAETQTRYQNVEVDGIGHQDVTAQQSLVCLEGPTRYYAIFSLYLTGDAVGTVDTEQLHTLSESFRLTEPVDVEAARVEAMREADAVWQALVAANAGAIDAENFGWVADQLTQFDLAKADELARAQDLVTRYLGLADGLGVEDQETVALREGLQRLHEGDPAPFRQAVGAIVTRLEAARAEVQAAATGSTG